MSLRAVCRSPGLPGALHAHGNFFHDSFHKELSMNTKILMGALVLLVGGAAMAQPSQVVTPRIDQREANQEKRIDQGVKSGQLTPRETKRLDAEQGRIERAEARAKADGKVTPKEREHIEHMQNKASRDIAHEKHDKQRDMNHDGRKDKR
jgi:hypothetical protein